MYSHFYREMRVVCYFGRSALRSIVDLRAERRNHLSDRSPCVRYRMIEIFQKNISEATFSEASALVSIYNYFLFLEGARKTRGMGTPQARNPIGVISR